MKKQKTCWNCIWGASSIIIILLCVIYNVITETYVLGNTIGFFAMLILINSILKTK